MHAGCHQRRAALYFKVLPRSLCVMRSMLPVSCCGFCCSLYPLSTVATSTSLTCCDLSPLPHLPTFVALSANLSFVHNPPTTMSARVPLLLRAGARRSISTSAVRRAEQVGTVGSAVPVEKPVGGFR